MPHCIATLSMAARSINAVCRYDAARLKLEEHFILATALNSSRLVWHQQQVALQPPLDGLFINTVVVSRAPGAFPKQAPGQRRTLVMIHGWCGAVGYWVRNFEGLLDTYHDIYAIDLLGWGRSSRPLVHDGKFTWLFAFIQLNGSADFLEIS